MSCLETGDAGQNDASKQADDQDLDQEQSTWSIGHQTHVRRTQDMLHDAVII